MECMKRGDTLLMSDCMPHAGGSQSGHRAHAVIAGQDFQRSPEEQTFWMPPRYDADDDLDDIDG